MANDDEQKGPRIPNLGKDDSSGPSGPSMTDLKSPSDSGPSLGETSSQSGSSHESSQTKSGGPTLGEPSKESPMETTETKTEVSRKRTQKKKKKKKKKKKINVHELVRKWGVARRRVRDALQTLLITEMKTKVHMTNVNPLFVRNITELMQGHIEYFDEMLEKIENGEDEISQNLLDAGEDRHASTVAFDSLKEIVTEEIKKLKEVSPIITEYIDEDLKRFRDARVEPRASWWVLWYSALQMRELHEKADKELNIVLEVILRYKPVMRRVLGVFLNFIDCLIINFEDFILPFSRVRLISNPTETGYNLAPWIKPRYGTYSQSEIEYEGFIEYYTRSFGSIHGKAPDFEGSPLDGYRKWIQNTLEDLEERLRQSNLITSIAKGDTLEGMLVGLQDQLEDTLEKREYDDEGKLTNQPIGGDGALKFLEWLFETALNRYDTTNISIQDETRMSLDMFEFIPGTVRWVNEYGERLVMDWLDPDLDDIG